MLTIRALDKERFACSNILILSFEYLQLWVWLDNKRYCGEKDYKPQLIWPSELSQGVNLIVHLMYNIF